MASRRFRFPRLRFPRTATLCVFFLLAQNLAAQGPGSRVTVDVVRSGGRFVTTAGIDIRTTPEAVEKTADKFVSQYQTDLESLFGWALTGVNLRGEADPFISFDIKSHRLVDGVVLGRMDMKIAKLGRTITGADYKVALEKTGTAGSGMEIAYRFYDCKDVIRSIDASVKVVPTGEGTARLTLVSKVRMSAAYGMLVSEEMYADNMGWRFRRFVENLADDLEGAAQP